MRHRAKDGNLAHRTVTACGACGACGAWGYGGAATEDGGTPTTLWTTHQGLLVESLQEQLWHYRLQAAAHDPDLHQRITHDLEAQLAATDDDYDLMPETEALMYTTPKPQRIAI